VLAFLPAPGDLVSDRQHPAEPSPIYEIRVRGHLSQTLLGAFPALQAGREGSDTILKGPLEDQAALHGILVQIERLGIELLEVRRLPALP